MSSIFVSSLPRALLALICDPCMHTTQEVNAVIKTLVFHNYYCCTGTIAGSCTHNHTTYSVCFHDGQYIWFNSMYHPQEQWLEVQSFTSTGKLVNRTWINDPNKPVSECFDECVAIAENNRPCCNCGMLSWERTYRLNDKYVCPEDDSGTSGCV
jgi:hypothetical protein